LSTRHRVTGKNGEENGNRKIPVVKDSQEKQSSESFVNPTQSMDNLEGKQACLRSVLQRVRSGKMNALEEARAMNFLIENNVVKNQAELAKAMDKTKSKVSEKLSILKLPRSVQLLMERNPNVISEGHAIELLRLKDSALIVNVTERILEMSLTRDRLRTEIGFLLEKHGGSNGARPKRSHQTCVRYFPRVDGGFDLVYRFRPEGDPQELENMITDMKAKLNYLNTFKANKLQGFTEESDEKAQKRMKRVLAKAFSEQGQVEDVQEVSPSLKLSPPELANQVKNQGLV
jgi:hypothetical protein